MNREIPDVQAGFRKGRGTRDQIANIHWIIKKTREFQKNIYFCFIDYAKAFVWITTNCGKFFRRWEYQSTLPASWEICMLVKKQQLELDMEQQTGSKSGKEYIKAVYCHPAYSTYMQSTSWEMLDWMKHKLEFWIDRGARDQVANIHWITEKAREFQKNIYFCFIDDAKSLWLCGSQQTVENSSRDGIPDHLTCLLRNLYAGQESTVKIGHGTKDWFKIGKGVHQGCILSLCLFNLHAEYIMWNAGLEKAQTRIKTAGRNINNLRYADDTTLMAESKEDLKSLLMKVKEQGRKAGLKLNIQKTKTTASSPIASWQIYGEKWEQ